MGDDYPATREQWIDEVIYTVAGVVTARQWAKDTGTDLKKLERPTPFDDVDSEILDRIVRGDRGLASQYLDRIYGGPMSFEEEDAG